MSSNDSVGLLEGSVGLSRRMTDGLMKSGDITISPVRPSTVREARQHDLRESLEEPIAGSIA